MNIENLASKYLNYLLNYLKENNIDESHLYQRMINLKVEECSLIDSYANYDGENNILKYNPTIYNGKRNVLNHECLHIAGGFESNHGFNEFVTQYLNTILFGNKKGYFSEFDYEIISMLSELIGLENITRYYFERDTNAILDKLVEKLGDNRGNLDGFDFLITCNDLYDMNMNAFFTKKALLEKHNKLLTILGGAKQIDSEKNL